MSLQIEIIRAAEFIRVGTEGRFDLPASKAALATIATACRKRSIDNAVLDLRAVQPGPKPVFTTSDLLELVNTFPEVGFTKRLHLAVLYLSDPHKRARLFAFVSTLHGWSVQTFGNFEHALAWLSRGPEMSEKSPRFPLAKPVPVRRYSQAAVPQEDSLHSTCRDLSKPILKRTRQTPKKKSTL